MRIGLRVKKMFFDGPKLQRAVDRASIRVLNKMGAIVRKTARWSIRSSKTPSAPGNPPRSKVGTLKKFILYAYDPATHSVVVGPQLLPGKAPAPSSLEHGGRTWGVNRAGEKFHYTMQKRPYMSAALDKTITKFPKLWAGAVKP